MYSPVHATAGFFVARLVPHPVLGIVAAVASHYLLDAVPHGDSHFGPWLKDLGRRNRIVAVETLDLGSAALMVTYLVATHPGRPVWYLVAGAVAGILPDLVWGLRYLLDTWRWNAPVIGWLLHQHDRLHNWGHAKASYDISFMAGILSQAIVLGAVLILRL